MCINNSFYQVLAALSISYTMGSRRQSCTILLSKQQRHSREVLSCTWDESWLHWCWGSPGALSTPRCKALLIPHAVQHRSSGSLKMCQLEVAQHRAWQGRDWILLHPCKQPLPGQAPVLGWAGLGELGAAPLALQQHSSYIPSQQWTLPGANSAVSGALLCNRLKKLSHLQ